VSEENSGLEELKVKHAKQMVHAASTCSDLKIKYTKAIRCLLLAKEAFEKNYAHNWGEIDELLIELGELP